MFWPFELLYHGLEYKPRPFIIIIGDDTRERRLCRAYKIGETLCCIYLLRLFFIKIEILLFYEMDMWIMVSL